MGLLLLCLLFLASSGVQAQQTSSVSSLFLSSGSELDFNLFGMNGGVGTNGTNSDRFAVTNQFNYSGASPSSYIVGFSHGDSNTLAPGTVFTLVSFGSTNFTAADAARFQAMPQGDISGINGTFLLNTTNGGAGTLQFQLNSSSSLPEPSAAALILVTLVVLTVVRATNPVGASGGRNRH